MICTCPYLYVNNSALIIQYSHLQDNIDVSWDPQYIAGLVDDFVLQYNITTVCNFLYMPALKLLMLSL